VYRLAKTAKGLTCDLAGHVSWCGSGEDKHTLKTIPPHSVVEFETWAGLGGDYKFGVQLFRGSAANHKAYPEWLAKLETFYSRFTYELGREDWNPEYVWSDLVRIGKARKVAKR
jgi:hypothetical protein